MSKEIVSNIITGCNTLALAEYIHRHKKVFSDGLTMIKPFRLSVSLDQVEGGANFQDVKIYPLFFFL
jgi:hypothetical protein